MTAEIVILNKSAIALAADSKVTVGGARMSKTYDTVNKLFTLSKCHPVGIMIYGSAEFMEYPWETLIKVYRNQKKNDSHETINDWSNDFISFTKRFGKITKDHKIKNLDHICRNYFARILDVADDDAISNGHPIGGPEYVNSLKFAFDEEIENIHEIDMFFNDVEAASFIKTFGKYVDVIRDEFFSEFADTELIEKADMFISLAIFSRSFSPGASGVVIAGFGSQEFFPAVCSLETDGYLGNKLKIVQESKIEITREMPSAIRAFAQGEMVQRFMTGIDPDLSSILLSSFSTVLNSTSLAMLDKYGTVKNAKSASVKAKIQEACNSAMNNFAGQFSKFTRSNFWRPIVQMVSLLPKEELANLAESLVALTSLKRRVSSDLETVGGAIDVALISKGDGFVWIKRKHYFPDNLNPHFQKLYFQD